MYRTAPKEKIMRVRMTYDEVRQACFVALQERGLVPVDVTKYKSTELYYISQADEENTKLSQDLIQFEFETKIFSND
jgi:hypothetical protein